MPASPAQVTANRRNAAKSTGPKTPEGKARVRGNALKHGLTGEGVALPAEDAAEVAHRFTAMQAELAPKTVAGQLLVRRAAFLSVRLQRSERHETATLANRVRHAEERDTDSRLAEVEATALRLYTEPATATRRLKGSPEGIDWLVGEWGILRTDLYLQGREGWTGNHRARMLALMGDPPANYRITRIQGLSEALQGFFNHLEPSDGAGLEGQARADWARNELAALIDAEVARLAGAREALDLASIEADRAEAGDRALFDASPGMVLARKYEAATERAFYKALKQLGEVEAAGSGVGVDAGLGSIEPGSTDDQARACGELALNFPAEESEPEPEVRAPLPAARSFPSIPFPLETGSNRVAKKIAKVGVGQT